MLCVYRANDCILLTWLWLWAGLPLLCVNNYLQTFSHLENFTVHVHLCVFTSVRNFNFSLAGNTATAFLFKSCMLPLSKNSGTQIVHTNKKDTKLNAHLPFSHGQLILQLYEPVFLDIVSAVVDGENHWSGQQGSWRSTAHHWAKNCLDVLYWGSGKHR